MSDAVVTRLDRPYGQQPETRAAATRYLERTGNADLAAALGLTDDEQPVRPACPTCEQPLGKAKNGGWRPCQRKTCKDGAE